MRGNDNWTDGRAQAHAGNCCQVHGRYIWDGPLTTIDSMGQDDDAGGLWAGFRRGNPLCIDNGQRGSGHCSRADLPGFLAGEECWSDR